jgi:hypothetical protein
MKTTETYKEAADPISFHQQHNTATYKFLILSSQIPILSPFPSTKLSNTQVSILYFQDKMQFSLKLIAAAAFLLPNLIVARVVSNDAVAKREAFASPEAEALSNFEITRRDFESSIEAAQVKRDAYADAIAHVESLTSHQLVTRGQQEDLAKWETIHTAYKAQSRIYDALAKDLKKETDTKKKDAIIKKIIAALEK